MNFIMNMILGVIPDILYFYLYIKEIKNIKKKKVIFIILLFVSYMITNILVTYNFYIYILFDILLFFIIKWFYKSQINDFFLIIILDLYLFICSIISYFLIPNYFVAFIIYRILLFAPLIFKNKIKNIYEQYCKLWNRHDNKSKIKSITIRNIVLIMLNLSIIILYFSLFYITRNV